MHPKLQFLAVDTGDIRWQGRLRWGPRLLVPITALSLVYLLFTAITLIWSRVAKDNGHASSSFDNNDGIPDITSGPLVAIRFVTMIAEAINIPAQCVLIMKHRLNPVTTLIISIFFLGGWTFICFHSVVTTPAWYGWFDNVGWKALTGVIAFSSAFVCVCYVAYLGFSAAAIDRQRKAKKNEKKGWRMHSWGPEGQAHELGSMDKEGAAA